MLMNEWKETLFEIGSVPFQRTVETEGRWTAFIGSRPAFAAITLRFEESNEFEFISDVLETSGEPCRYAKSVAFGVLDVFVTSGVFAITKAKVSVVRFEEDAVTSTPWAFRLAAREAARKAITS